MNLILIVDTSFFMRNNSISPKPISSNNEALHFDNDESLSLANLLYHPGKVKIEAQGT